MRRRTAEPPRGELTHEFEAGEKEAAEEAANVEALATHEKKKDAPWSSAWASRASS